MIYEVFEAPFVSSVEVYHGGAWEEVFAGTDTTVCGSALQVTLDGSRLVEKVKVYTDPQGVRSISVNRDAIRTRAGPRAS